MEESTLRDDQRFLRPKRKNEGKEPRFWIGLLKKTIRVTLGLLFFTFFLLVGHRLYGYLLEDPLFRVREVEVKGCQKIPRETLLSMARLEGMPNLFRLRLKEVVKRLELHPWIESVSARKVFPSKLMIEIEERRPMAILQLEDPYYIDGKGVVFSPVGDKDGYNFPFLTGLSREALENHSEEAKELIRKALELLFTAEKMKAAPLAEISEIHIEGARGLHCFSKEEGIEVIMGWGDYSEKLRRLSLVWADLGRRGISATAIDCRDLDRIVVRKNSGKRETGRR